VELKPQLGEYLPSLDGIRAICIGLVIGCHAADSVGFPAALKEPSRFLFNGHLGVTVFFVLSGFLITLLLVNEEKPCNKISLKAFYTRRFIRILPVYFAYLLVVVVLFGIDDQFDAAVFRAAGDGCVGNSRVIGAV